MMRTLRTLRFTTLFAAMAVLVGMSPVSAADVKVFQPSICNGLTAADNAKLHKYQWLENTDTTYAEVSCGLVRDNTTNTNGLAGFKVRVSGQVSCSVFSQDIEGFAHQSAARFSSSGDVTLDWGTSINVSSSGGTYMLYCAIWPGAAVRSIWMSEY